MNTQYDSYIATDIVEQHKQTIKLLAGEDTTYDRAPSTGMFYLLQDICALTLSIDEHETYEFHHVIGDADNRVPERHIAVLMDSIESISDLMDVKIELQFMQGRSDGGIIIPQPPPKRSSTGVSLVYMRALTFTSQLIETASGRVDPNVSLRNTIGAILALQSVIEESKSGAFVLTLSSVNELLMFDFFQQSIAVMEVIIRNIAEINEISAYIYYYFKAI